MMDRMKISNYPSSYCTVYLFLLLRLAVGALLAIFSFLTSRATAVGAGNVLFLFGLSLHFTVVVLFRTTTASEDHAAHDYIVYIIHVVFILKGG